MIRIPALLIPPANYPISTGQLILKICVFIFWQGFYMDYSPIWGYFEQYQITCKFHPPLPLVQYKLSIHAGPQCLHPSYDSYKRFHTYRHLLSSVWKLLGGSQARLNVPNVLHSVHQCLACTPLMLGSLVLGWAGRKVRDDVQVANWTKHDSQTSILGEWLGSLTCYILTTWLQASYL